MRDRSRRARRTSADPIARGLSLGMILVMLSVACAQRPWPRPHVVLVIIDTLRADRLGAYGFPLPSSPELDRLAARGVRFDRVISQATWTRASIGSLLTSLPLRTLGIYNERGEVLHDRFTSLAEVLRDHGYTTLGATANPNINSHYGFDQGFDFHLDSDVVMEWMQAGPGQGVRGRDGRWLPRARELFDALLAEIDRRGSGPFYLQVDLMEVHEHHDERSAMVDAAGNHFPSVSDPRARRYVEAIRALSGEIDRFLGALAGRPGWAHTLVAITSDHGETLGDHPQVSEPKWHGHLVYESQARVPLILYAFDGRLPRGLVVKRPVRLLDLMPTLLDAAGAPIPHAAEGVSLLPLLADPSARVGLPEVLVVETRFRSARKLAAYTDAWTYVENLDEHPGTSPRELQRAGEPADGARTDRAAAHPEIVSKLERALRAWERTHPPAPPAYEKVAAPERVRAQLRALGYLDTEARP